MSLPGARIACIGPVRDGQHAEAEARMLLGTIKPGSEVPESFSTVTRAYMAHQDELSGALASAAESLAAFVGEE